MHLELNDGGNEDLIKKNKKRKKLGSINVRITMKPMTKEEMNEVFFDLYVNFKVHIQPNIIFIFEYFGDRKTFLINFIVNVQL